MAKEMTLDEAIEILKGSISNPRFAEAKKFVMDNDPTNPLLRDVELKEKETVNDIDIKQDKENDTNQIKENDKKYKETNDDINSNTDPNSINNIIESYIKNKKTSKLLKELYRYSPKYTCMVCHVYNSPGPTILYTAYVRMEGTEILKVYLSCAGFIEYNLKNNDNKTDYRRFVEYNCLIDQKIRSEYQKAYKK